MTLTPGKFQTKLRKQRNTSYFILILAPDRYQMPSEELAKMNALNLLPKRKTKTSVQKNRHFRFGNLARSLSLTDLRLYFHAMATLYSSLAK